MSQNAFFSKTHSLSWQFLEVTFNIITFTTERKMLRHQRRVEVSTITDTPYQRHMDVSFRVFHVRNLDIGGSNIQPHINQTNL